jgi:hypothetical protein
MSNIAASIDAKLRPSACRRRALVMERFVWSILAPRTTAERVRIAGAVAALMITAGVVSATAEPAANAHPAQSASIARAQNAPTSGFANVNGVRLHYLDWGGSGEPILLLTGFRDNAHVYDDFAPRFTDHFHVLGLTRRGFGESDKPLSGYDTDARLEDIRQFLDDRRTARASLIGHSMAARK